MTAPTWLDVLRAACAASSQAKAAARLKYSAAVVNQALRGRYRGSLKNLEARVRAELMGASIVCPVLGLLPLARCLDEQRRPFSVANPQRVQLYGACRRCPNRGGAS